MKLFSFSLSTGCLFLLAGCLGLPSGTSVRRKFEHEHPHGVIEKMVFVQKDRHGLAGGASAVAYRIYYTEPPSTQVKMSERTFHQVVEGMVEDTPRPALRSP